MIRNKLVLQQLALKAGLYTAFTLAYWMAYWVRFGSGFFPTPDFLLSDYLILYLVSVLAWGALCRFGELDRLRMAANQGRWVRNAAGATVAVLMVIFFGAFFIRTASFSRLFVVLLAFFNLFLVFITPRVLMMLARWRSKARDTVRILIVGDGAYAERVAERIRENSWIPCRVAGYVAVGDSPGGVLRRLGTVEDLESICRNESLDEIMVALPLAQLSLLPELKQALARVSVPSRLVCDFLHDVAPGSSILEFFGTSVVNLYHNPVDSLVYALLKRSFDVLVAGCLLVLLSPLVLFIAVLVKLTSPGPAFFSQKRVGLHGFVFMMYKFRTMRVQDQDTADLGRTTEDDERRTSLGSFLRHLNLDELPQLWNVVRGDMSLVGPRPEVPHYVYKYAEEVREYNVRHFLRSGITGWAQVNGWRGQTSIARRVECDLYYLQNWSFGFDLKILWLTLWRGFRDRNAY